MRTILQSVAEGQAFWFLAFGLLGGLSVSGAVWNRNAALVLLPPVRRLEATIDRRAMRGIAAFAAGVALGGSITGAGLWLAGGLLSVVPLEVRLVGLLVISTAALLSQTGLLNARVPSSANMIPISRFDGSVERGMVVFGVELGLGFRTQIVSFGPYLLAAAIVLVGPTAVGLVCAIGGWSIGRTSALLLRMLPNLRAREHSLEGASLYVDIFGRALTRLSSTSAISISIGLVCHATFWILGWFMTYE